MEEMGIGAGKAEMVEMPRPNLLLLRRGTVAVLALLSTLLLTFFLAADFGHAVPAFLPPNTPIVNSQDVNVDSDRCRLSPADHIFRNTTTITQTWRISSGFRRPDGVLKRVYLINDDFPGPTVETRSGDTLEVHLLNGLEDEGIAMHFHGLQMQGANAMDGAVGITQDPIQPGQSFTYRFTIDSEQHGTFWYHAHEGVQRADGLFGGFVVHKPAIEGASEEAAHERLLLVGDWYHRSAKDALHFYMHPGAFGMETVPDSILLNGAGSFNCADAVPARPLDCLYLEDDIRSFLRIGRSRRTILRVVNVGAYAGVQVAVSDAILTPLAVDSGHAIAGEASKAIGFIHPGERVAMLIEADSGVVGHESTLKITLDDSIFKYENTALTTSHGWPVKWTGRSTKGAQTARIIAKHFDTQASESLNDQSKTLPAHADQTIVLYTLTQKLARLENEPRGFINSSTWMPQSPPLINTSPTDRHADQFIALIPYDSEAPKWVDVVLNNLDEDSHPFHLHGHNLWVLARHSSDFNWGSYNPYEDESPPGGEYDLKGAVRKDTVYVPRRGYVVLRFRADNPGVWAFHCHVLWHEASGMVMAFDVR